MVSWTDKQLKHFKEFNELDVKDITIEHIDTIEEGAKGFQYKLSSLNTIVIFKLIRFLMKENLKLKNKLK